MSFLSELQNRKSELKETNTVVTKIDGQRFLERNAETVEKLNSCHGYVVDTKPDNIPVLIVDHLYIGSQDCAAREVLKANNIKRVLSLGINVDVDDDICCSFANCLDLPETDVKPILTVCLPFIHEAVVKKQNVLIHCNAGVSRTGMVAIAYLMKHKGMNYEDAYNFIKQKRPAIQPNAGFRKQLNTIMLFEE